MPRQLQTREQLIDAMSQMLHSQSNSDLEDTYNDIVASCGGLSRVRYDGDGYFEEE